MNYLAVLGRQPEISMAELEAVFPKVRQIVDNLALVSTGPAGPSPSPKFLLRKTFWGPLPGPSPVDDKSSSTTSPAYVTFSSGLSPVDVTFSSATSPVDDKSSSGPSPVDISRFGGILKLAEEIDVSPLEFLKELPEGKITIGVSDYSSTASRKTAQSEALKLKKILVRHGRSVRVVENKEAVLSTATSLHNGLSGKNPRKVELIRTDEGWYRVIGVQDIEAYARRDQTRPARDAKVGMLPPKLAQILINLCGPLEPGSTILDPFCGTGVVLQEALLMGYRAYGTDINERMVEYTKKNLEWLIKSRILGSRPFATTGANDEASPVTTGASEEGRETSILDSGGAFKVAQGDATSFTWEQPVTAVVCEGYLGKPMSKIPTEMELRKQKQECGAILRGFLENLASQLKSGTPVVIAAPAWLRPDGTYERLDMLDCPRSLSEAKCSFASETTQDGQLFPQKKVDEISAMGYNVSNKSREGLLYHRKEQVVARDIIIVRKK